MNQKNSNNRWKTNKYIFFCIADTFSCWKTSMKEACLIRKHVRITCLKSLNQFSRFIITCLGFKVIEWCLGSVQS